MIELYLTTAILSAASAYCGILWYAHRANRQAMQAYAPYYTWMHKGRKVK